MNKIPRIIFHIDMNAFFASCEIAQNESLRGKPIVVAHDDPLDRGIIVSPSYEARKYGIHAPMIVREAKKLYPYIIVVNSNHQLYEKYSKLFKEYLLKITPLVEMASIDEAYIDITDLNLGEKSIALAQKIQNDLLKLYKLPCSIGIAPNKFLAKMASDMKKPLGITILRKRDVPQLLWPLPIEDLLYIGKKTSPKLKAIGINKIGDLVKLENKEIIIEKFGENFYNSVLMRANGVDDSLVTTEISIASSVSSAHTFMNPIYDISIIYQMIKVLINSICYKLQTDHQLTLNVGIQIRDGNYLTINRSKTLFKATNDEYQIFQEAKELVNEYFNQSAGVRLISVFCSRLIDKKDEPKQISIFDNLDEIEKKQAISKLLNDINEQFGKNSIKKGI